MPITLTPEQEAWLDARVARGDFNSIEEAARRLIDERIAERMLEEGDDLAWAKPLVAEGLAALNAARSSRSTSSRRETQRLASRR